MGSLYLNFTSAIAYERITPLFRLFKSMVARLGISHKLEGQTIILVLSILKIKMTKRSLIRTRSTEEEDRNKM